MKTTHKMHGVARLFAILLLTFCSATPLFAQAFDGEDDSKIYLGYTNVGGKHGCELGYDEGINDYLSYGARFTILANKVENNEEESRILDYSDFGFYFNFHWMEILKLPDQLDIYMGPMLSFKTASFQTGVRYNFSELFGLYASCQYNFFETFKPRRDADVFPHKFAFSAGITISI